MTVSTNAILAIVGPTASGKTELALEIAARESGELISVDSRQVYRELAIGTAKPSGQWTKGHYFVQGIPYHLLDIWEPDRVFSAANFLDLVVPLIEKIQKRGKKPILVGGTGLYFKALMGGLAPLPTADPALREKLKADADKRGREHLHRTLAAVDPESARKIPANNIQRLVRALEVYTLTGKPISQLHEEHKREGPSLVFHGIDLGREALLKRIEARCRGFLQQGMIEETEALLAKGIPEKAPALTGLGYPRVMEYLQGALTQDECLALLIQDTRQYAKRQMTWFRHQHEVRWTAPSPNTGYDGPSAEAGKA